MGYKTKIQSIKRKSSEQFYINLPMVHAQALGIESGEEIEWTITSDGHLIVERSADIVRTTVKKRQQEEIDNYKLALKENTLTMQASRMMQQMERAINRQYTCGIGSATLQSACLERKQFVKLSAWDLEPPPP